MFPNVRSRFPNGRCAADRVAASSRQYEAPVMPHNVRKSVTTPGSASIQAVPALNPARRAAPRPASAPAPAWATTRRVLGGWVLGEVTAPNYATRRGRAARRPRSQRERQFARIARSDSRSDPMVASTADGS